MYLPLMEFQWLVLTVYELEQNILMTKSCLPYHSTRFLKHEKYCRQRRCRAAAYNPSDHLVYWSLLAHVRTKGFHCPLSKPRSGRYLSNPQCSLPLGPTLLPLMSSKCRRAPWSGVVFGTSLTISVPWEENKRRENIREGTEERNAFNPGWFIL